MVPDGQAGYLSQVGDVGKLAQDMLRLLRERPLARRLGEAGRARAASRYASDSVEAKTVMPLPRARRSSVVKQPTMATRVLTVVFMRVPFARGCIVVRPSGG